MKEWDLKVVLILFLLVQNVALIVFSSWVLITFAGGFYEGRDKLYAELMGTVKNVRIK
jgi:Na+/glutamate symporter